MKLCLSMIEDGIRFSAVYRDPKKNSAALLIERFAFYAGESSLSAGILYLCRGAELLENVGAEPGAALLCLGMAPEALLRGELPLLVYDGKTDLFALANEVVAVFEHYRQLEEQLNEAVYRDRGYTWLTRVFAPYIGNEVMIVDANYRILAESSPEHSLLVQSGLSEPDHNNMLPLEVINFFKGNATFQKVKALREPFFYQENIFRYRCLCMNIVFEEDFALRVVVSETGRPFRDFDPLLLKFFTGYVDRIYQNAVTGRGGAGSGSLADVLHDLLLTKPVEMWQLRRALQSQKWEKSKKFLCMCIKPTSGDYLNHTIYYHCAVINTHFPGTVAFEFERNIVCLINLAHYDGSKANLHLKLVPLLRDNDFRAGFSNVFEDMDRFVYSFKQASIALEAGMAISPAEWFYNFSEQAVGHLLEPYSDFESIMILGAKEILVLRHHDEKNNTSFLETVRAYYKHHLNTVKTAQALYIHRATMIHRLERIRELSGLSFDDAGKNLYCQLTLMLLEKHERRAKAETTKREEPGEQ